LEQAQKDRGTLKALYLQVNTSSEAAAKAVLSLARKRKPEKIKKVEDSEDDVTVQPGPVRSRAETKSECAQRLKGRSLHRQTNERKRRKVNDEKENEDQDCDTVADEEIDIMEDEERD
jgi:hypothetical protein